MVHLETVEQTEEKLEEPERCACSLFGGKHDRYVQVSS